MTAPLPLTVDLKPREPGFSLMARLAARNGVSATEFGQDMGLPFGKVMDGDTAALAELAKVAGVSADDIIAWSPAYVASRTYLFRGERFHAHGIRSTTVQGCPICLREDANASDRPPHMAMAIRSHWLVRHVSLCHRHQHPLVSLWSETTLPRRMNTAERLKELAPAILSGQLDVEARDATDFDDYLERRILEGPRDSWLDQHSLYAGSVFCDLLGRALVRLEFPLSWKVEENSNWGLYQTGYDVARHGESAIRAVLTTLQHQIGEPWEGPKKKFAALYDRLSHDLTGEDYAPFRALLRTHIIETWPLGPGDELMGEPVLERRKHSVNTAAREVNMDPRRLRKLLADADLIGIEGDDSWEIFDAAAAAPFLARLNRHVSALELRKALSISRSQFDLLRQDGYLAPTLAAEDHKPLWDLAQARSFIDGILRGAENVIVPMHDWTDLPKASARLKIRPGQVIQLIENRRLTRVGKHQGRDGYDSILIHFGELESLLNTSEATGMTIEVFARSVGLKPPQAGRLIKNGHTSSTIARNPKTRAEQHYMRQADIAAFNEKFVTLRNLAVLLGQSWQSLRVTLHDKQIQSFSPDGLDYGPLYEWSVLEALDVAHRP